MNARTIAQMRDLTQANHHTLALVTLAQALGNHDAARDLQHIEALTIGYGYIPQPTYQWRSRIADFLLAQVADRYPDHLAAVRAAL